MSQFHSVPAAQFSPLFDRISDEWMLISASDGERTNSMTASWGCFGILWNKPVAVCFIRPQRYTFEMTEKSDRLSLAFFTQEHRKALAYMGAHSGRDGDKYTATGLHISADENGTPYPAEAHTVVLCKTLYAGRLQKDAFVDPSIIAKHYPADDYHQMYVCEIEQILVRD
jgi:flavin reductase (DIM6/NTAB) family NADH-FMN oxidoreductase RutF